MWRAEIHRKHYKNLNHSNLRIHGEVPCAKDFLSKAQAMIVPLLSGSGMRVKILEGMAMGQVVITTQPRFGRY